MIIQTLRTCLLQPSDVQLYPVSIYKLRVRCHDFFCTVFPTLLTVTISINCIEISVGTVTSNINKTVVTCNIFILMLFWKIKKSWLIRLFVDLFVSSCIILLHMPVYVGITWIYSSTPGTINTTILVSSCFIFNFVNI